MKTLLLCFCLCYPFIGFAQQEEILIKVHSNDYEFINVPVSIPLKSLPVAVWNDQVLYEKEDQTFRTIPHQIESGSNPQLTFMMDGVMGRQSVKEFVLRAGKKEPVFPSFEISADEETFIMILEDQKILSYQFREKMPPEGVDPVFRRSAFIHPIWSPSQTVLSRIQPEDHYHHYGIWNPWTKTKYRGEEIDFWNLGEKQGTVRFKGLISRVEGPVYGEMNILQDHIKLMDGTMEETVLHEKWSIRAWKLGKKDKFWLIDFTSILNCAEDSPLELTAYRYGGGIGFRAAEYWTSENTSVLTSEGRTREEADGSRAKWCMVSAGNENSLNEPGILFLSHSLNHEHPEPMRVWPSDANEGRGDLFFEFCPIRHNDWILEPGKEYALNYRLLVFDNPISADEAELYWKSFVNSPEVEIIKE
ncbi:MAG: PmoA family protein [Cyclobacteriaceae bacterium]|nr:PmoA family protein [Cyclobacteriaceae bacterium]